MSLYLHRALVHTPLLRVRTRIHTPTDRRRRGQSRRQNVPPKQCQDGRGVGGGRGGMDQAGPTTLGDNEEVKRDKDRPPQTVFADGTDEVDLEPGSAHRTPADARQPRRMGAGGGLYTNDPRVPGRSFRTLTLLLDGTTLKNPQPPRDPLSPRPTPP